MANAKIIAYDEVDSTNKIARELIKEGCQPGTVVRAERQTCGRGQYGRVFSSPSGGLYFSLILQPDLQAKLLSLITLAAGLACHEIIFSETGLMTQIKWPNDLYLNKKKIAGILCESLHDVYNGHKVSPWVIVGVGINVNNKVHHFSTELQPIITTLREESGVPYDLESLFLKLISVIQTKVDQLRENFTLILSDWQMHDFLLGKEIKHLSGEASTEGIGVGIDENGGYLLRDHLGKLHTVIGGQLRIRAQEFGDSAI